MFNSDSAWKCLLFLMNIEIDLIFIPRKNAYWVKKPIWVVLVRIHISHRILFSKGIQIAFWCFHIKVFWALCMNRFRAMRMQEKINSLWSSSYGLIIWIWFTRSRYQGSRPGKPEWTLLLVICYRRWLKELRLLKTCRRHL